MRQPYVVLDVQISGFNSRTPGGVRPRLRCSSLYEGCFNSRTPGGVRRSGSVLSTDSVTVSIHAPREGCDVAEKNGFTEGISFNSRTPGGVRPSSAEGLIPDSEFQFTHPGRGATTYTNRKNVTFCEFQFTHPGRGATKPNNHREQLHHVSIHAPREGCDRRGRDLRRPLYSFNSRTPGGVRLPSHYTQLITAAVSIHAPREGCDRQACAEKALRESFNSRTPGGVRQARNKKSLYFFGFQFTHPGRGATLLVSYAFVPHSVSIHAPREGCDSSPPGTI